LAGGVLLCTFGGFVLLFFVVPDCLCPLPTHPQVRFQASFGGTVVSGIGSRISVTPAPSPEILSDAGWQVLVAIDLGFGILVFLCHRCFPWISLETFSVVICPQQKHAVSRRRAA